MGKCLRALATVATVESVQQLSDAPALYSHQSCSHGWAAFLWEIHCFDRHLLLCFAEALGTSCQLLLPNPKLLMMHEAMLVLIRSLLRAANIKSCPETKPWRAW